MNDNEKVIWSPGAKDGRPELTKRQRWQRASFYWSMGIALFAIWYFAFQLIRGAIQ